ncbi:MAG TPA: electron transport complex subunit E [Exilispira sp.]|nr:electron transport complex subunit E [Exilispira sp.]
MSSKKPAIYHFLKGFWEENPVFVQILGTCPTLAVTATAVNGIGMGLATTFVLILSCVVVSIIKNLIPNEVRIGVYTVIIAAFVTLADLFLKAYFPDLSKSLGPFVPLIVVNCIIFGRIEAFSAKNNAWLSFLDALGNGLGFTITLIIMGSIRELLGKGTWFGIPVLLSFYKPMLVMILPTGAFFTYGTFMAISNALKQKS